MELVTEAEVTRLLCDKCREPIPQDRVYYEVEVKSVNQKPEFVGRYFFHTWCWDELIHKTWRKKAVLDAHKVKQGVASVGDDE